VLSKIRTRASLLSGISGADNRAAIENTKYKINVDHIITLQNIALYCNVVKKKQKRNIFPEYVYHK
jgi:hypothetical protein